MLNPHRYFLKCTNNSKYSLNCRVRWLLLYILQSLLIISKNVFGVWCTLKWCFGRVAIKLFGLIRVARRNGFWASVTSTFPRDVDSTFVPWSSKVNELVSILRRVDEPGRSRTHSWRTDDTGTYATHRTSTCMVQSQPRISLHFFYKNGSEQIFIYREVF